MEYETRRVWVEHEGTGPHRIELERAPGAPAESERATAATGGAVDGGHRTAGSRRSFDNGAKVTEMRRKGRVREGKS